MLRSILSSPCRRNLSPSTLRHICTTPLRSASWVDKVKGVFTGQKPDSSNAPKYTLLAFAEEMRKARKLATLKQAVVGRGKTAHFGDAFEKQEAIIRYLGGVDPAGEKIEAKHKQDAAKQCNCTVVEVETTLAKFKWAKEAQKKCEQLQAEGKPLPKNMAEIQKLMGSSPMDAVKSNLAQNKQISRNAPCPCGSKKLYKRCCGKDTK